MPGPWPRVLLLEAREGVREGLAERREVVRRVLAVLEVAEGKVAGSGDAEELEREAEDL